MEDRLVVARCWGKSMGIKGRCGDEEGGFGIGTIWYVDCGGGHMNPHGY